MALNRILKAIRVQCNLPPDHISHQQLTGVLLLLLLHNGYIAPQYEQVA
jgi:hypothetical protein